MAQPNGYLVRNGAALLRHPVNGDFGIALLAHQQHLIANLRQARIDFAPQRKVLKHALIHANVTHLRMQASFKNNTRFA